MALLVACSLSRADGFQTGRGRDPGNHPPTPTPTPAPTRTPGSTRTGHNSSGSGTVKSVPLAQMTIIAPPGCQIWINNAPVQTSLLREVVVPIDRQRVKASEQTAGVITIKGIRPDTYTILARKPDFHEFAQPVIVTPAGENVVTVTLRPIAAKLSVSPSVAGGDIEIVNLETNSSFGHYFERFDQLELPPGHYRIVTSKAGYKHAVREITLNPGGTMYLEPVLESLPPPTPTPTTSGPAAPMSFTVERDGKYLVFHFQGSSGDSGKLMGSVTVSLNGPARNGVSGNLNGLPCEIELIKLENIAEGSIIEAPGPRNNWTAMVVRVRPKDERRRPISFAINWRSLTNSSGTNAETRTPTFVPAQAIRQVKPDVRRTAQGPNVSGTVVVAVTIDKAGSVTSSKAIEGPITFRNACEDAARKWKFRPATRDGEPVESDQVIQFRFEP